MVLFSYATGGMSGDIFQLYVTRTLGYSPSLISVVALTMIVSVPIQLFAPRLVESIGHRRTMIGGSLLFIPSLLLLFAAGDAATASRTAGAICLIAGTVSAEIAISISYGAAWSAWVADFTTSATRPVYLSIAGFASQGTLAAAFVVQTTVFGGEVGSAFYHCVLGYCLLYTVASVLVFRVLPDPVAHHRAEQAAARVGWREILSERTNRVILLAQIAQFLIGVPLLSVYAISVLAVPAAALGVVLVLRTAAALAGMPMAGWFIARFGTHRALAVFGGALVAEMVIWTVLPEIGSATAAIAVFTVLVLAFQLSKCVFAVATGSVEFDVVEPAHRVRTFTLMDIVSSAAMQANIAVGGLVVALGHRYALVDNSFIRLDAAKVSTAAGAFVALLMTLEYRRLNRPVAAAGQDERSARSRT
ncbi:MFS transporter [Nocardia sp. NPDC003345]